METTKTTSIVKAEEFGLKPEQGEAITKGLKVILEEREVLSEQYQALTKAEINEETIQASKKLRLAIRDNRTKGIEKWHEANKAYWLAGGKFVDAVRRKEIVENERMEENLQSIENHYENLEKQRLDQVEAARKGLLEEFPDVNFNGYDLRNMDNNSFRQLLEDQRELKSIREKRAQEEAEQAAKLKEKQELAEVRKKETMMLIPFIPNYSDIDFGEMGVVEYVNLLTEAKQLKFDHEEQQKKIEEENKRLKEQADKLAQQTADREAQIKATQELQNTRLAEILPFNDPKKNLIDLSKLHELTSEDYNRILTNKKAYWQKAQDEAKAIADKQAADKKKAEEETARLAKELADKKAAEEAAIKKKAEEDAAAEEAKKKAAIAPDKDKLKLKVNELKYELSVLSGQTASALDVEIKTKFDGFQKWAIEQIDKI